jgi:ketosteroid isomerase-like protein
MLKQVCGAAAALAMTAGCAGSALAQPSGDEAAIRALEAQFAAAASAKDVDAIMKVYAPGVFVYDLVPPRQYVGADAYRKDWMALMSGFKGPLKFEVSDLVVEAAAPLAWSHSTQRVVGTDPTGQPTDITVRVTDVYRKTADGWRIVHEHVSVPVDLATGKPDLASKP